jgi:hypothetical protein
MKSRTKSAAQRLNPDLPAGAIEPFFAKASKVKAVEEICRDFYLKALSPSEGTFVHGKVGVHGVREHLNIVNITLARRS